MERKFAVIQWSEGQDSGKFSDVKIDSIRGYDDSKMDQHGNPFAPYSAVVEWRHGKKPRGGWPHYRGTIVFVCANRFEASRKINLLLKEDEHAALNKSASPPPCDAIQDDSDDSTDNTQILTQSSQIKKPIVRKEKDPAEEFLRLYGPTQSSDVNSPRKTVTELRKKVKYLQEENATLKDLLTQDVPELLKTMRNVIDLTSPPKRSKLEAATPPLTSQSSPLSSHSSSSANSLWSLPRSTPHSVTSQSDVQPDSKSSKVEIHPGTGVMVERLAWAYAMNATSATVFVRHLLTAVFPVETLLVSNLRGGKRGGLEARQPLDKQKLDAIYSATLEKWPGTPLSCIGSTINCKITELRAKSKNVPSTSF